MKTLNLSETERMLKNMGICRTLLTKNFKGTSRWNSFPCRLKMVTGKNQHKAENGGVKIANSKADFEKTYNELLKIMKQRRIKNAKILVQEFVEGTEVIISLKKDSVFGHIVLLGIGGVLSDVMKDVSIRKCPVERDEAMKMIDEIRFRAVLGFKKKADIDSISEAVVKISNLPKKYPKIIELEINPFIIGSKGGKVCNAKVVVG